MNNHYTNVIRFFNKKLKQLININTNITKSKQAQNVI